MEIGFKMLSFTKQLRRILQYVKENELLTFYFYTRMLIGSFDICTKTLIIHRALKIFSTVQFLDGIFRLHSLMFIFRQSAYLIIRVQSTGLQIIILDSIFYDSITKKNNKPKLCAYRNILCTVINSSSLMGGHITIQINTLLLISVKCLCICCKKSRKYYV